MNTQKGTTAAITGVCVAMAAGTAAYMMAGNSKKMNTRKMKKNAGRAVRAVGQAIDHFSATMH